MNYLNVFKTSKQKEPQKEEDLSRESKKLNRAKARDDKEQRYKEKSERLFKNFKKGREFSSSTLNIQHPTVKTEQKPTDARYLYPNYIRNGVKDAQTDIERDDSIRVNRLLNGSGKSPHIDQITSPIVVEHVFGECIELRNNFFKFISDECENNPLLATQLPTTSTRGKPTLGPPDMIHIAFRNKYFPNRDMGQFFFVTGAPCWNIGLLLEYLKAVFINFTVSKRTKGKFFEKQDFFNAQKGKLNLEGSITIFMYDIFSGCDLRLQLKISDESYQIYLHDPVGEDSMMFRDIDEAVLWDEILISSLIRSTIFNTDSMWRIPGLVQMDFLVNCNELVMKYDILSRIIEYLPSLILRNGMDESEENELNYLNNYMITTLCDILEKCPKYVGFVVSKIKDMQNYLSNSNSGVENDEAKECYDVVLLLILLKSGEHDLEFSQIMKDKVMYYKKNQWILTQLMVLQLEYLYSSKKNYEMVLKMSFFLIRYKPHLFTPWVYLVQIYEKLGKYDLMIKTFNKFPKKYNDCKDFVKLKYMEFFQCHYSSTFFSTRSNEINKLELDYLSNFYKIKNEDLLKISKGQCFQPLPNLATNGYLESIWNNYPILQMSPICGYGSHTLIGFVTENELNFLQLNRDNILNKIISNQQSFFLENKYDRMVYSHLLDLFMKLGERRFKEEILKVFEINKINCEEWLQEIVDSIVEDNETVQEYFKFIRNDMNVRKSRLEWHLFGCLLYKQKYFRESVLCFRTCLETRFDPISSRYILEICLREEGIEFDSAHNNDNDKSYISKDLLLQVLIKLISYDFRFYNILQMENTEYLKLMLMRYYGSDLERMISEISVMLSTTMINDKFVSSSTMTSKKAQANLTFLAHISNSIDYNNNNNNSSLINAITYLIRHYLQ